LFQVGTEDVLLLLFAAVVQCLVEGPAQSRDQLFKGKRRIISRPIRNVKQEKQVEQTNLRVSEKKKKQRNRDFKVKK